MKLHYFFFLLLFSFSSLASNFEDLNFLVNKAIEMKTLPGGALLIGKSDKVLYRYFYKTTDETIYDLASLTKITTAMSILILEEQGKLRVSDKISKYYLEFNNDQKKNVTIENLLRHNGGVAPSVQAEMGQSYADFIKKALSLPLDYFPGEKTVYSDVGFIILGDIVQKVSGLSLKDFTTKYIFSPLGMTKTGYAVDHKSKPHCAPTAENKKCIPHDPKAFTMYPHSLGHAGVFSHVDDLSRLAQLFIKKGIFQGKRILKEVSVRKMTRISNGEIRALGFDLLSPYAVAPRGEVFPEGISYGHTGFTGTTLWIDPQTESYYIFLSNRVFLGEESTGKPFTELRRQMATLVGKYIYKNITKE